MNAKEVALIAKNYFDETRTNRYYLFETSRVEKGQRVWTVECEIKDIIEGEWKHYKLLISDTDGTILDVIKHD